MPKLRAQLHRSCSFPIIYIRSLGHLRNPNWQTMLLVIDYQLPNYQPSSSSKRIHTFITAEFKFRIAMLYMLIAGTRCIQQFTARRQVCLLLFAKNLLGITDERLKNIRINRVQIYAASHTIIQPSSDEGRMKGRVPVAVCPTQTATSTRTRNRPRNRIVRHPIPKRVSRILPKLFEMPVGISCETARAIC